MSIRQKRYFILVGDAETWQISLKYNLWGFSESTKGSWNRSDVGDLLAFYVTSPTKKIIGFGEIVRKFVDDTITWPDEIIFKKSIWKYRLEFRLFHVINNWEDGISLPAHIMLNSGRRVVDQGIYEKLVRKAQSKWGGGVLKEYWSQ